MKSITPKDLNDIIKRLKTGEKVIGTLCGKGGMIALGNSQTTKTLFAFYKKVE